MNAETCVGKARGMGRWRCVQTTGELNEDSAHARPLGKQGLQHHTSKACALSTRGACKLDTCRARVLSMCAHALHPDTGARYMLGSWRGGSPCAGHARSRHGRKQHRARRAGTQQAYGGARRVRRDKPPCGCLAQRANAMGLDAQLWKPRRRRALASALP